MRRGISLIVLIVTIIVLIILTGVTINELTNKDVINEAKITAYLADWNTFKNEMDASFGNEQIMDLSFDSESINATWNGTGDSNIRKWIPSFTEDYKDDIIIENGELTYIGGNTQIIELVYGENNPTLEVEPTSTTNHSATALTMDWSVLGQIANKIAQTSTVTYTTEEVKVNVNGTEYIIGVGDKKTLTYDGAEYTARILGFNHDTIVNTSNKAGISFEFTSIPIKAAMNSTSSNAGGYEAMPLRTEMNSTYYNKIDSNVKGLIKTVEKNISKHIMMQDQ